MCDYTGKIKSGKEEEKKFLREEKKCVYQALITGSSRFGWGSNHTMAMA